MRTRNYLLLALMTVVGGCVWQEDPYELTAGRFRGTYRVFYSDEEHAKQELERLCAKIYERLGPDEAAENGRPRRGERFFRWRQNDDHLRVDLYVDDLSKSRFEKGTGFRLSLSAIDDIGNRIRNGYMDPKPGDRRYDVFHDPAVMGEWTGWHWGETKKDSFKRIREPQEFEWGLIEDQLAWARLHGTTRREALKRWDAWRAAHPEWDPYAFSTNRLVVLDCDSEADDLVAMMVFAKDEKRGKRFPGVCVATYGSKPVEATLRNMVLGVMYFEASTISVRGAAEPIAPSAEKTQHAEDIQESGCMGGVDYMDRAMLKLEKRFKVSERHFKRGTHSWEDLVYLIMKADDVTYITTGPLTTLARLLEREPKAAEHIKRLYAVDGHAEGNFRADGQAVRQIFASGLDITIFPEMLATAKACFSREDFSRLCGDGHMKVAADFIEQNLMSRAVFHDVLPALYTLHPEKFQTVDQLFSADQNGHVSENPEGRPVHVVTDMEQDLLLHSLSNGVRRCFDPADR